MFYLTKFRFMHKHDSLSLSIRLWQLKKKNKPKNINQAALYRTMRTPKMRSLQFYCRIHIYTYIHMYIFLKGLSSVGRVNSQVSSETHDSRITSSLLQGLRCCRHPPLATFPE